MISKFLALFLSFMMIGSNGYFIGKDYPNDQKFSAQVSDMPEFSDDTMFTLRIYEPWIYESLHYTLKSDGMLIVLYYNTELGRETLSEEKMRDIRDYFSPEYVYNMNIGEEDDMTDGCSRYIVLYDDSENEILIGGYELVGGDRFNRYFDRLYAMLEDDYTKQFSDLLLECMAEGVTFDEKYLRNVE
ncbi:MAG: hypothetical protein II477_10020 [Lachnospiraceae bacterium]|nr:hypothetical protein [Lachnospiraceae bacterium]